MKKIAIFFVLLSFIYTKSLGTHLMGGSLTYAHTGIDVNGNHTYHVTLKIYRYCDQTGGGTAALDPSMMLGIYDQDPLNPNADKIWFQTSIMPVTSQQFITPPSPGIDCSFSTSVCVEEGIYESDIALPPSQGGYHLMVERCCRNGNIVNLSNPGGVGMTYYAFIPPDPIINSSPIFTDIPVPYICVGDTISIVNNAVDPDGDVLQYSFETPYIGYSGTVSSIPDPQFDNNPYVFPIPTAFYNPGYSVAQPFGATGYTNIDVNTGQTSYYMPNQGFFVVAVEIKEYRNSVLISSIRMDLQLIAIACPPNNPPNLSATNGSGTTSLNVIEGNTICFPSIFIDPNGDSLFLTPSGSIFNIAVVNPPATMAPASGLGIANSLFCWSTECGMSRPAPYQFTVNVIDNGCPPKETNVIYSITVLPGPVNPTPSVSIAANPAGPICTGTAVTFTATPTFGGTSPIFQWQLNGVDVGTNSNTYSSSTLNNGDVITCIMTSNSVCVTSFVANSNPIAMVVNPFIAPTVSISAVPAGPVCSGTNVTFTANATNAGATPVYQWTVNGVNVGTNSPVFSSTTLSMGNIVGVSLTADANCPSASSNTINMTVYPTLVPSVTITANVSGTICPSQSITFTATPVNGGSPPAYQWTVNGVNAGTNSSTYTAASWSNNDQVQVTLTSSVNCPSPASAVSNILVVSVGGTGNPSVSISASPSGAICAGDNVTFTAVPVLGGTSPSYQWKKNGINVGTNSSVFSTSSLSSGDVISVVLTSNSPCATIANANSNNIVMVIDPIVSPSVSITANVTFSVCLGTSVSFTAVPVNGGSTPAYQWQVNGLNTGPNSAVFTTTTLANGDWVRCIINSNARCVSPVSAASNVINAGITAWVTPSVTIATAPSSTICAGTNVTFTAAPANGGTAPVYQWKVNGINVGTNSNTYSSATLTNNSKVVVIMTSDAACPLPASVSDTVTMIVNPVLVPAVTISVNPSGAICQGDTVVFTASLTNPGSAPNIQWKVNGLNVGTNSTTYTSAGLNNGDVIETILTSNALCVQPAKDTSNQIAMTVNPIITPVITITANPSGPICYGTNVVFSSNYSNGGTAPSFQWYINGNPVGSNQPGFSGAALQNGDIVNINLTSNGVCLTTPTDLSNNIVMTVNPNLTPAVSIISSSDTICPNDFILFTSTSVNEGSSPVYQWSINGVDVVGANSSTFLTNTIVDGDAVRVKLTSSEICVTTPDALSNIKVISVNVNLTPLITISQFPDTVICQGDEMKYTAVWANGGVTPHFKWYVNGVDIGLDSSVFVSHGINTGDVIDAVLLSNATCALPTSDTSNTVTTLVDPILTPAISISANPPGTFCDGTFITYSSVYINEGPGPLYQWTLNGSNISQTGTSFTTNQMQDLDTLQCILTSNVHCPSSNPVFSNQIIIDRLPPLAPVITGTDTICFGKDAAMNVTTTGGNSGPYYYSWNNNLGSDTSFVLSPPVTTHYTVTVYDSCSTPRQDNFTITVNQLPVPGFDIDPPQATILNPFFDMLDYSANTAVWNWNFGDTSYSSIQFAQHTYLNAGYYTVQLIAESAEGCVDSLSKELYVEEVTTIYIPNSFSPNNDGKNDVFQPAGHAMPGYSMTIYNRWGQKVFFTDNPLKPWRGEIQNTGKLAPQGVYVFTVLFDGELEKKNFQGRVTLIR